MGELDGIIRRYARLLPSGKPIRCTPSLDEIRGITPRKALPGTDRKIIYDDRERAEWAAREMFSICGERQVPYPCRRSASGHFHLRSG
jgi:hypothetical protein